nr:hypothetical protein GCM10020185_43480 [Pseudomonas brassicacearum subsp. brassicacearum]
MWTYRRNARGDVIVLIDPDGRRTEYAYDAHGQLLATYAPDGGEHRFTWSRLGQLTEEILPDGGRRCFFPTTPWGVCSAARTNTARSRTTNGTPSADCCR